MASTTEHATQHLTMFVICEKPKDFPKHFVVRRWCIDAHGRLCPGGTTLHGDLTEARNAIPLGRYRLEREPDDDPVIVESWI